MPFGVQDRNAGGSVDADHRHVHQVPKARGRGGGHGRVRRVDLDAHVTAGADRCDQEAHIGVLHRYRDVFGVHHASRHDLCAGMACGDPVGSRASNRTVSPTRRNSSMKILVVGPVSRSRPL
nr:hypothetical protein [Nonomuraea basaltis]